MTQLCNARFTVLGIARDSCHACSHQKLLLAPSRPLLVLTVFNFLGLQEAAVRDAADAFRKAFVEGLAPGAVRSVLPGVLAGMVRKRDWQTKVGALRILGGLTRTAPRQVAACLPTIVPAVSECMCDAKRQVQVRWRPVSKLWSDRKVKSNSSDVLIHMSHRNIAYAAWRDAAHSDFICILCVNTLAVLS